MSINLAITSKGQGREDNVIPFPGNIKTKQKTEEEEAKLGITNAVWAMHDAGIWAALLDLPYGPSCQSVYESLLRRLPNVFPSLTLLEIDSGKSRSMVTRALNMLEAAKLISRRKSMGRNTVYDIADLRNQDVVRECHTRIRQLRNQELSRKARRRNTKPIVGVSTRCMGESSQIAEASCTGATSTRRMDASQLGAPVHPKDINKKQTKKQAAAKPPDVVVDVVGKKTTRPHEQLEAVLRKWGLQDAIRYLLNPEHDGAINVLIDRSDDAVRLIDIAMRTRSWKPMDGVGLRVNHLREHIADAARKFEAEQQARQDALSKTRRKANELLFCLPQCDETGIDDLSPGKRSELLEAGLRSFSDDATVVDVVRNSVKACRKIIANELELKLLHEEASHMSDEDIQSRLEEVLDTNPNLRRFLRDTDPRSWGNQTLIVQRLREERHG